MKVLTVTNQKGGVGKTALALHLAFAGQERCMRVLLIDLDTQGSASITLTGDATLPSQDGGSGSLFTGGAVLPRETTSGIALLHGHQKLDAIDASLTIPETLDIRDTVRALPYDLVVIDTPPAIGLRHVSPMLWCDSCLTPLEPNGYSVAGLSQTLETLAAARRLNPRLETHAVINRHIRRSKGQQEYIGRIGERLELTRPFLSLHVAVADALDSGVPVWRFQRAAKTTREQWTTLCGGFLDASLGA